MGERPGRGVRERHVREVVGIVVHVGRRPVELVDLLDDPTPGIEHRPTSRPSHVAHPHPPPRVVVDTPHAAAGLHPHICDPPGRRVFPHPPLVVIHTAGLSTWTPPPPPLPRSPEPHTLSSPLQLP